MARQDRAFARFSVGLEASKSPNSSFRREVFNKAFLDGKPITTEELKQPAAYQKTGKYYPPRCSGKYDAGKKQYSVTLEGLALK